MDYLLYWLNKNDEFGYVSSLGLEAPNDNTMEVLFHIAVQRNLRKKMRQVEGIVSLFFLINLKMN